MVSEVKVSSSDGVCLTTVKMRSILKGRS